MTPTDTDIARLVAALAAAAADPALPRRRARVAEALADRLLEPARVTLVGTDPVAPAKVANALLGTDLVAPDWPTTRIEPGPSLAYEATLADRSLLGGEGLPDPGAFALPAALLEVTAPLETLSEMSLLVVRAGGGPADLAAALRWAARRTDIALWCGGLGAVEWPVWQAAPEALRNHAFLVAPRRPEPTIAARFTGCLCTRDPDWLARLSAALAEVIAEACAEDAAAAEVCLAALGPIAPAPVPVEAAPADPALRPLLSRLVLQLRGTAAGLLADPAADPAEALTRMLEDMEVTLALADPGPALARLREVLTEAAEVGELLRHDAAEIRIPTAAALMAQLRRDLETELEQAA